jgi:NAD(P)H-flavin reductase
VSDAPFARRLLNVTANTQLGPYRLLSVADPDGPVPAPGQFSMLTAAAGWGGGRDERPYLPRACSVARHRDGQAQYLLEDVGPGTGLLCALSPGAGLWALGPLGTGFTAPEAGTAAPRALLIGGGVGIAPLAILGDSLPGRCTALLGFRDLAHAAGAALLEGAQVATDDGSAGHHGPVTDLLISELDRDPLAIVYACGPAPMLERVRSICAERQTPCQLALESGMACGFGACYGCAVPRRGGGYLRVCLDGPVIDGSELDRVDAHAGAPACASTSAG